MTERPKKKSYDHKKIEKKWQTKWSLDKTYRTTENSQKPKAYVLDMFPYPSGEGLHVGHPKGYIATDIYSRFKRMSGFNVLHPMGWDAFGLPAENYAIKNKINPAIAVKENIKYFKSQLEKIGLDYDWSKEINTTDPDYYKWTQWIFLQLYKNGLAYQSDEPINWCPSCKTGLANEDLEGNCCERCGSEIIKKPMRQWVLKITDYAERLLTDLKDLNWSESIKESQRNWIGRSEGFELSFPLKTKFKFVILHGWKGNSRSAFIPWLKKELESFGHEVVALDLPHPFIPDVIEQAEEVLAKVKFDANTVLVGHSLGSVVAYRVLEKLNSPIKKLVLVGGLIEPRFRDKTRLSAKYLIDWKFNLDKIKKNAGKIIILEDRNDQIIPDGESVVIQEALGGKSYRLDANKSHFCGQVEPAVLEKCLDQVKVFTTRPDTLFGATYLVLAPEHDLINEFETKIDNLAEVKKYITKTKKKTEVDRLSVNKEKTGIALKGLKVFNPLNHQELPLWVADYVLPDYGTGAVMAVPAHDERDYQFAQKFSLPIIQVITKENAPIKSYLMGARDITDAELEEAGATIYEKKPNGDRLLILDKKLLPAYEELISRKLTPGFWNEYLGNEIVFIFKNKKEKIQKLILTPATAGQIEQLVKEFINQSEDLNKNVWQLLADNDWYQDLIIHTEEGLLINSEQFNHLKSSKAKEAITKSTRGKRVIKYKLRDWVFSRQRYWGEPIPIIHCPNCGVVPVAEKELPVKLPPVKSYLPTGTGESPLAKIDKWVKVFCPLCRSQARRETNTMPQWAGSSWYYLRYLDPKNNKFLVDKNKDHYWSPVDVYVGGTEHATRHLIYARFWHKFLQDIGVVNYPEPFKQLKNQGLILGVDGRKMSKRWGNVINPDQVIKDYGADTLRVYEMFMGPFEQGNAWSDNNLIGSRRFIEKIWRLSWKLDTSKKLLRGKQNDNLLHRTIKQITRDINNFNFNTAISALMILVNDWDKQEKIGVAEFKILLKLLAPFIPHLSEELWFNLGEKKSIHLSPWPEFDQQKLVDKEIKIVIQINGKVRAILQLPPKQTEKEIIKIALNQPSIKKHLLAGKYKKTIFVKDRLLNFVT